MNKIISISLVVTSLLFLTACSDNEKSELKEISPSELSEMLGEEKMAEINDWMAPEGYKFDGNYVALDLNDLEPKTVSKCALLLATLMYNEMGIFNTKSFDENTFDKFVHINTPAEMDAITVDLPFIEKNVTAKMYLSNHMDNLGQFVCYVPEEFKITDEDTLDEITQTACNKNWNDLSQIEQEIMMSYFAVASKWVPQVNRFAGVKTKDGRPLFIIMTCDKNK